MCVIRHTGRRSTPQCRNGAVPQESGCVVVLLLLLIKVYIILQRQVRASNTRKVDLDEVFNLKSSNSHKSVFIPIPVSNFKYQNTMDSVRLTITKTTGMVYGLSTTSMRCENQKDIKRQISFNVGSLTNIDDENTNSK